jgi:hypothetical protein
MGVNDKLKSAMQKIEQEDHYCSRCGELIDLYAPTDVYGWAHRVVTRGGMRWYCKTGSDDDDYCPVTPLD